MRRYEQREMTITRPVEIEAKCDGCGIAEADAEFGSLTAVAIEVNLGEEFGCRDEYDYCNDCLIAHAPMLTAAGSRSSIVNTEPQLLPCPACGVDHEPPLHDDCS
jgi:hypothetical protein